MQVTIIKLEPNDYFTSEDMSKAGEERWDELRARVRSQGYRVIDGYGHFSNSIKGHFIFLDHKGDLIHTIKPPRGGKLVKIDDVLGARHPIKMRTGNNKATIEAAFDYLVDIGYSAINRNAIVGKSGRMVGLIAHDNGVIYSIATEGAFNTNYRDADELLFEVKTTHEIINVRHKQKLVEVNGHMVDEKKLAAWLELNSVKSTA